MSGPRFNTQRNNDQSNQADDSNWKAEGFLNFSLPTEGKDGKPSTFKVGAIPLKSNRPGEKALIDMIEKDPENAVKAIAAALVIDYRSAKPAAAPVFKL